MDTILQNWENATIGQKCLVGVYTTIIAMGIVFLVLFALELIIKLQSKVIGGIEKTQKIEPEDKAPVIHEEAIEIEKKGITEGEADLYQVENEEVAAVIMAAVCEETNIPMPNLKIKSIKLL